MAAELPFRTLDVGQYLSQKDIAAMEEICRKRHCSIESYVATAAVERLLASHANPATVAREVAVALRVVLSVPGIGVLLEDRVKEQVNTALKHAAELP